MILGSLLSWMDPAAAFNKAAATIVEQPPSQEHLEEMKAAEEADQAERAPANEPKDKVVINGKDVTGLTMLPSPDSFHDVRAMSPRDLGNFAHELYMEGVLKWEEYRMVGFPTELNPDFAKTIGALTGEKPEPDRPRDQISDWERRVDFERTHNADNPAAINRTERILNVLKWHEVPKVSMEV